MHVTVIASVLNEENTIAGLLTSLQAQTRPPDEIIIADGGSTDRTVAIIQEAAQRGLPLRVVMAPGSNISQARNRAIADAASPIIACTDAGVRLDPHWLEELLRPFTEDASPPDVVSGFFLPDPRSTFEAAMGATVLPRLADIAPARFLPSSRSVAFRKAAWRQVGGYPEWLDYCEDLVFDLALRRAGARFVFAPRALVYFRPRSSLRAFFTQYYRYARGDGKADLWRKRHAVRYVVYMGGAVLALAGMRQPLLWLVLVAGAFAYCFRPFQRLVPYLRNAGLRERAYAFALVPLIRLVGDVAKMVGYPVGVWWRLHRRGVEHSGSSR